MMRIPAHWAWTLLFLCGSAVPLQADYKESFRRGIQAYNRRNWTEAARHFRAAIAEQASDTGERINISGMDFRLYLPQFYLGVALKNSNNCREALEVWRRTNEQGLKRAGEIGNLTAFRRECETVVAKTTPPPFSVPKPDAASASPVAVATPAASPRATPHVVHPVDPGALGAAIARARSVLDGVRQDQRTVGVLETELRALRPLVWQEQEFGPAQANARRNLESAQSKFDTGSAQSDMGLIEEARSLATTAADEYSAIQRRAMARRDELRRDASAPATPTLVPGVPVTPALRPATAAPIPTPPGPKTAVPNGARPGAGRLPKELLSAAQLFFSGNYAQARDGLAIVRLPAGSAAAHGYLFQAAAAYLLYLTGGEKDRRLLEEAIAQVRLCRVSDPMLKPDPRAFTPRFLEFFASTF